MTKEFPCKYCPTYNKDTMSVCECSELQNYNHYQQGRADKEKEIYIEVNDECWHRDSYDQGYDDAIDDCIEEIRNGFGGTLELIRRLEHLK